jgi:hypothetical protein
MNINVKWHTANKMPKNPKVEDRVKWHKAHLKNCKCRTDVPSSLQKYFVENNVK